jgi:glycosyltransferase involved in cell wall biosynthesis
MMMGVPTIRSNVEGASDQIENGINGYIFENENPIELSKYISLLVQNKKLRKDIGGKGTIIAINKFSEDIMMDKLIQVYKEAIRMGSKNQKVKPEKKYS